MKHINSTSVALGVAIALAAGTAGQASAAEGMASMKGAFHLTPERGPIRRVDMKPFNGEVSSEILADPTNGLETAYLVYTRMAPHAKARGLYTLPIDEIYSVVKGELTVQIGTDQFVAKPDTLVIVPAGVPHQAWNAGGEPEETFETFAPAPSRDLASLFKPAVAKKIDNAAQYVHVPPALGKLEGGTGHASLNERVLISHENGSLNALVRLNDMLPGGGRTELHMHPFDQAYFIKQGNMKISYGARTLQAPSSSLVVLPAGTVHSNENAGTTVQSVITLLLPDPPAGTNMGGGINVSRAAPGAQRGGGEEGGGAAPAGQGRQGGQAGQGGARQRGAQQGAPAAGQTAE